MRNRLLLLAALTLAPLPTLGEGPAAARQWITLSNVPGKQGLGRINANGYAVDIVEYRDLTAGQSPATPGGGDPYNFTGWLNAYRASRGRRPVAWDASLVGYAAANSSRGFNHNGPNGMPMGYPSVRRENVGWGPLASVEAMWTQSPGHNSALLDPSITGIALAYVNGVWTFNAR